MFGSSKRFAEEFRNLEDDAMAAHQSWIGLRAAARKSGDQSKATIQAINAAQRRQMDADEKVDRARRSGRI